MKNYLAIFFFTISVICSAQSITLSTNRVCVDTIPYTFESTRWGDISKHRFLILDCWTTGGNPVVVTKVVKREYGYSRKITNNTVESFPEKLEPGKKYQIKLFPLITDSCTYIIYTSLNDSAVLKVYTNSPGLLEFVSGQNSFNGIDGRPATLTYVLINRSAKPIHVDSIRLAKNDWLIQASVPAELAPGDTFRMRVITAKDTGSKYMLSTNRIEVHFHEENSFPDFVVAAPFVHYTHGVIVSGNAEHNFGRITNSKTLLIKTQVKNTGWRNYDLNRNKSAYVRFSKNVLVPGDTATAYVEWNPVFANDTFAMQVPLFKDTRNNQSTVTFGGICLHKRKQLSPDSMIWMETTHFSFDTVSASSGRVEKAFKCRNNSPVPIIVREATTGDGGSMAWSTHDTIQPGEEFTVMFTQDLTSRYRHFERTLTFTVAFQGGTNMEVRKLIRVTGYVVRDGK